MKKKPEIILIGGGGHCKAVIDVIETENKFQIAGVVDVPENLGQKILNYEIIAKDNDIPGLTKQYKYFFITVGHIQSPVLRIKLFNFVKKSGGELPVIISPNAHVSKHAKIGEGTIIMHNTIINAGSEIGDNCIINNKALIEHDCRIGSNCHISTNTIINGNCVVGNDSFAGSCSVLKNGISIVPGTIIGAGAVVINNLSKSGVYVGNPAQKIK